MDFVFLSLSLSKEKAIPSLHRVHTDSGSVQTAPSGYRNVFSPLGAEDKNVRS
jgi:hypothetical protein